ncbi:MAG TPA: AAA family ATPase [Candidatus Peribacteraceae bacterium]|nr:AAA family ATPase [Candidatus Peribacteraceae bacterium]
MNASMLNFAGTKEYLAVRLRSSVLGPAAIAFYVLLSITVAIRAWMIGTILPFIVFIILLGFSLHIIKRYLVERLENDDLTIPQNASITAALSVPLVERLARKKRCSPADLLIAAIASPRGTFMLDEMGISGETLLKACSKELNDEIDVLAFLEHARGLLPTFQEKRIDGNLILYLFFSYVDSCKELLKQADLSEDDLNGLLHWEHFHAHFKTHDDPWEAQSIIRASSMGRSWVMGYTTALDQLTSDVDTHEASSGEESIVIHEDTITEMLRTLSRARDRNVLVMGKVGVGKRTLIRNAARTLRSIERAKHLPFTRIVTLHTESLLSGVGNPDAFLLQALSRAQSTGRFVLVINDFSLLLRSANANLHAVLMKFLQSNAISVIGIVDTQDYHSLVKVDPVLDSQFEKIVVEDCNDEETMEVLMAHYFGLNDRSVRVTYKALKAIVELSKRFLGTRGGLPGRAIDVMDDAVTRARERGEKFVREDHVREVVSVKSRVNVLQMSQGEKERLLVLEDSMKQSIIGQQAAIRAVVNALKRARLDLHDRKKPVGTFLFLGPTGVGKTQTAKVLARDYFGADDAMIRLDMNEYSHADSVFNIIGQNGSNEGFLAQRVQDKPFSLILLDEIEKAHPAVLNLFLQVLDEGFLMDNRGMRTDFRNAIIIATSNAGALFIRDFIKDHPDFEKKNFKNELIDTIIRQQMFSPEFINRFDEVVLFYPLTLKDATDVAMLMIGDIVSEIEKRRGIKVELDEDVVQDLVARGYSIEFGAREMRRVITEVVEDYIADYLLKNDVKRGETIVIAKKDLLE